MMVAHQELRAIDGTMTRGAEDSEARLMTDDQRSMPEADGNSGVGVAVGDVEDE